MKKKSLERALELMKGADPDILHNPAIDWRIMIEDAEIEMKHYRNYRVSAIGLLKPTTPLLFTAESIDAERKFSYYCSDCGLPKFHIDSYYKGQRRTEGCRRCGD